MKNVLILGAGLVSRPIVHHLLHHTPCNVVVGSLEHHHANALVGEHPRGIAREVDVGRPETLKQLIAEADIVVSLVPYAFHPGIASVAIDHGTPMVTTSYVSDEMAALDRAARDRGVLVLNEIGLDPGLDHMSAMRLIASIREEGGAPTAFSSYGASLPSAGDDDNPWRYRFSWSPRGALLAGTQSARYLRDERVFEVPGDSLAEATRPFTIDGMPEMEVYPNRDALRYVERYGIEGVHSMFRGTLRYPGWAATIGVLARAGLLATDARNAAATTSREFAAAILEPRDGESLRDAAARRAGVSRDHDALDRVEWIGLFSDAPLPEDAASPLDVMVARFEDRLGYARGQRDVVILRHEIDAAYPDGRSRRHVSQLVVYGEPTDVSATARTVSLPAAIAAERILDGEIGAVGVRIPIDPEIYDPVLGALAREGLEFEESSCEPPAATEA